MAWHESIKPWISRYLISLKYENLFTFPHFVQNNLTVNYYFKGKIDCQTDCIVSAITFQDIMLIRCQLSIKDELWSLRMGNGLYTRFLHLFVELDFTMPNNIVNIYCVSGSQIKQPKINLSTWKLSNFFYHGDGRLTLFIRSCRSIWVVQYTKMIGLS